jgi:hypothetical protein
MKRSKLLPVSILIALGLLICAANENSRNKEHQNRSRLHHSIAEQQASPTPFRIAIFVKLDPAHIAQTSAATLEKNKPAQKWYERPTITDWGILVVTLFYVCISLGLLYATWTQARLARDVLIETKSAANAAKKSAEATREAVQVSKSVVRPYIWVRKIEGSAWPPLTPDLGPEFANVVSVANCYIQNLGTGPAFITEVVARLKFSCAPLPLTPTFEDCFKVEVLQPVVTASEPTNFFVMFGGGVDSQTAAKMGDPNGLERFSCYGIIRYEDVFRDSYSTTFGFSRQRMRSADSEQFQWQFIPFSPYNRQLREP